MVRCWDSAVGTALCWPKQFVVTVCHRYNAIHVLFSVVLCSDFAGMHPPIFVCADFSKMYLLKSALLTKHLEIYGSEFNIHR